MTPVWELLFKFEKIMDTQSIYSDRGLLREELHAGPRAATRLAEHLRKMHARKAVFPVLIQDEKYEITVAHIPVKDAATISTYFKSALRLLGLLAVVKILFS